jgi:hypothetical protein
MKRGSFLKKAAAGMRAGTVAAPAIAKKFRDEQFLWFRVAEASYDNYSFNSRIGAPAPAGAKTGKKG